MENETETRTVIEPDVTDVMQSSTVTEHFGLRPWRKGQSGNPAGRPKRKTLKEIAQECTEVELRGFVRHVYDSALESSSATAVRWAQLYVDILGESGASFKLAIEASGWDSFQSDVLRALLQREELPERLDSGNQAPPEANT